MPELPDIAVYLRCLEPRTRGQVLERIRLGSPFVLRTFDPAPAALQGKRVVGLRRVGKRVVLELEETLFVVLHLMIAGRLHWRAAGTALSRRQGLLALDFSSGTLILTEAGTKRRASLHLVRGEQALRDLDPGGLEVLQADLSGFSAAVLRENRTLKRALADPRILSGIGNAYSDEILHRARLSPVKLTQTLEAQAMADLYRACRDTLTEWTERLWQETRSGEEFPEQVTAFREGMAVHGRFGQPCPVCGAPVQRIRHAHRESNYCPRCQTGGRLLADRALSRLLKADWPRTLEELEELHAQRRGPAEQDQRPPAVRPVTRRSR